MSTFRWTKIFSFCHPVVYQVSLKRDTPDNLTSLDFFGAHLKKNTPVLMEWGIGGRSKRGGRLFVEKSD